MISSKVNKFLDKYNLKGTFIVAFSGGYDSMCLLDILYKLKKDIVAVHLNHNWRGEESKKEEENCRKFAKKRQIKYYSETLAENIPNTETAARDARYSFFERCAKKYNSNVVFTAHNFNDNAETLIYRIIKGTGINGLQGINENRGIFYRPLLDVSRDEIEQYCKGNNLTPNIDSSNQNIKYNRNFIRHEIMPMLEKINPKAIYAINSLSQISKEETNIIKKYLPKDLINANKSEQKIIIRKLLEEKKIDFDKEKIENIYRFISENKSSKSGKIMSLNEKYFFFVSEKKYELVLKKEKSEIEVKINTEGEYKFDEYIFSVEKFNKKIEKFPSDKDFLAYIAIDAIDFTLRYRKDGDIIQPLGISGCQKLKKYLNEKKIPNHEKNNIVLLTKKEEVLWVAGIGLSEKVKVVETPTHIIKLRRNNGY